MSLSEKKQSEVIETFSSTSRNLDDLLIIDNNYFDGLISQIYPSEFKLKKANSSESKAPSFGFAFVFFFFFFFFFFFLFVFLWVYFMQNL